jgi:Icc-related predicted phosphoesterase
MRIIAFSDIHGKLELLDALKSIVSKEAPDLIVFSGDIVAGKERASEWFNAQLEGRDPVWHKREIRDEEAGEIDTYEKFFSKVNDLGVPVLVVPGNIDAPKERYGAAAAEAEEKFENVHVIHNTEYRYNGFVFRGFGGEITEELREDRFVQRYRRIDIHGHIYCETENLILVTHSPPVGQKVSKEGTREKGSPVVNDLLETSGAFLLFCGHAHIPEVEKLNGAYVVNPGSLTGQSYAVVDVKGRGKVEVRHCKI